MWALTKRLQLHGVVQGTSLERDTPSPNRPSPEGMMSVSPSTVQDEGMYTCNLTVSDGNRNQHIIDASGEV